MSFGYGVTKERTLEETVLKMALKYAKLRLNKWEDIPCSEIYDNGDLNYGCARARLHNRIAEALDCDRELVEKAFVKAAEPFGCRVIVAGIAVDRTMKNDEDFTKIYDAFCDNLQEVATIEDPEKRHPNRITKAQLDEIGKNPVMGMPST